MAATAALVGLSALTAYNESQMQEAQGEYASAISKINARRADIQAADALKRGEKEAQNYQQKVSQTAGSQRAQLAAQGVSISSGSAADLIDQTYQLGAEDVQTIRNNAFREAMGYRQTSADYTSQGRMDLSASKEKSNLTLIGGGLRSAQYLQAGGYLGKKP